jgi:septum formation protein
MSTHNFIYLASASPRRQALLQQIGVRFELLLAGDDEDVEALETVRKGERPTAYVQRVTQAKLHAAIARLKARGLAPAPVLCADTTVALGAKIYGKPLDARDAALTLNELAGKTHRVLTAVALATPAAITTIKTSETIEGWAQNSLCVLSTSRVSFAPLTRTQIAAYIATGEPFGKAGAYAIQGVAASFISHLSGSTTGVMGLPLFETHQLLLRAKVKVWA